MIVCKNINAKTTLGKTTSRSHLLLTFAHNTLKKEQSTIPLYSFKTWAMILCGLEGLKRSKLVSRPIFPRLPLGPVTGKGGFGGKLEPIRKTQVVPGNKALKALQKREGCSFLESKA